VREVLGYSAAPGGGTQCGGIVWHLALFLCLHAAHTYLGTHLLACPRAYCSPILCAYGLFRGCQWNAV
jgi:hypothetical protein